MVYSREITDTFISIGIPLLPKMYYLSSDGYWYFDSFNENNGADGYERATDPWTVDTLNGIWERWEDFYKMESR